MRGDKINLKESRMDKNGQDLDILRTAIGVNYLSPAFALGLARSTQSFWKPPALK